MLNQGALTLANITWLLAAMAFVIAPHVTRLPVWVSLTCAGAGAARRVDQPGPRRSGNRMTVAN